MFCWALQGNRKTRRFGVRVFPHLREGIESRARLPPLPDGKGSVRGGVGGLTGVGDISQRLICCCPCRHKLPPWVVAQEQGAD